MCVLSNQQDCTWCTDNFVVVLFVGLRNCNVIMKGVGEWPHFWFITVVLYVGGTGAGLYHIGFPHKHEEG